MTCRRCPACGRDRTRIRVWPYTCSCGFRAAAAAELVAIADCTPPITCNVGCVLTKTFSFLGFRDDGRCGCAEFAAELDRLGPAGCRSNFRSLAPRLAEKAAAAGVPLSAWSAAIALHAAIVVVEIVSRETPSAG